MRTKILLLSAMCGASFSYAQQATDTLQLDEIVISGTRFETPVEKSGKTIYKISPSDIESNSGKTIADLLNRVPGFHTDGNFGTPGTNISYNLRGGRNKGILVLIDGVPLNDPSSITTFYDFRLLSLDQVESVEVLNGGLSSLYGANASAGVVNIILKKSSAKSISGDVGLEYGSFDTWKQSASVSGKLDKASYLLSINNETAEGFSAAEEVDNSDNFERDGFLRQNGMVRGGYNFSGQFSVELLSSYSQFQADVDDGAFTDNDSTEVEGSQFTVGLTPTFKYSSGEIKVKTTYATNENDFRTSFPSKNRGRNLQIDLTDQHYFSNKIKGLFGVNIQKLSYKDGEVDFNNNQFTIIDPYASMVYDGSGLNLHAGLRLNTHSTYDSKFIYNINPSYLFDFSLLKLKLRAGLSNAYITPSLYQLYSIYGNTDLLPEESLNYEGGVSFYLFDNKLTLNAVYFMRDEKDLIDFVSILDDQGNYIGGEYQNVQDERKVSGVEFELSWKPNEYIDLSANYTHATADQDETFYRIPENKWGGTVNFQPTTSLNLSLTYQNIGKRIDFDFITFSEIAFDSYSMIDLYAGYHIIKGLKISGAVNNLLDEEFVGVYGFSAKGRNYNVGVKYTF